MGRVDVALRDPARAPMPRRPKPWQPPPIPCLGHVISTSGARVSLHAHSLPPLVPVALEPLAPACADASLCFADDAWTLEAPLPTGPARLRLDPSDPKLRQRQRDTVRRDTALAQAFGRLHDGPLWDLTAGLGRDALALAARGFHVTAVERDPVVGLLLADLARRLRDAGSPLSARLRVFPGEAADFLSGAPPAPAAVFLDPMFSGHRTRGDVKKDLALLRLLARAEPGDDVALFDQVRAWLQGHGHSTRVVVKRPRTAPPLHPNPTRVVDEGGSTRFDVYDLRP